MADENKDLPKLLRAIASGDIAKANRHDIIFDAAADELEGLRRTLADVMRQAEGDLKQAHAEICKLQNLDPEKHNWPEWTPQAHTLLWFTELRKQFGIAAA